MFYSLSGELIHAEPGFVVVECMGVGYKCLTTINTQKKMPNVGEKVKLYTHLNVREDAIDLFGFYDQSELGCFKMLTSVSGVGAKVGLGILSSLSHEQVAMSIASGDSKTLTRAPGVGNKLAQRIILELKDKLKKLGTVDSNATRAAGTISSSGNTSEAINALSVLGYVPSDIALIVAKFDSSLPVEELIRLSLKEIAGGK